MHTEKQIEVIFSDNSGNVVTTYAIERIFSVNNFMYAVVRNIENTIAFLRLVVNEGLPEFHDILSNREFEEVEKTFQTLT